MFIFYGFNPLAYDRQTCFFSLQTVTKMKVDFKKGEEVRSVGI